MDELRAYLKSLSPDARADYAWRCGTTIGYLRKALSLRLTLRERLCARLEVESGGAVTRCGLRPDDYIDIWPELAAKEAANA